MCICTGTDHSHNDSNEHSVFAMVIIINWYQKQANNIIIILSFSDVGFHRQVSMCVCLCMFVNTRKHTYPCDVCVFIYIKCTNGMVQRQMLRNATAIGTSVAHVARLRATSATAQRVSFVFHANIIIHLVMCFMVLLFLLAHVVWFSSLQSSIYITGLPSPFSLSSAPDTYAFCTLIESTQ